MWAGCARDRESEYLFPQFASWLFDLERGILDYAANRANNALLDEAMQKIRACMVEHEEENDTEITQLQNQIRARKGTDCLTWSRAGPFEGQSLHRNPKNKARV